MDYRSVVPSSPFVAAALRKTTRVAWVTLFGHVLLVPLGAHAVQQTPAVIIGDEVLRQQQLPPEADHEGASGQLPDVPTEEAGGIQHVPVTWLEVSGEEASALGLLPEQRPSADTYARPRERHRPWYVVGMLWMFFGIIFLVCLYVVRHYFFTVTRLYTRPRQPYLDIETAQWPPVTVLIPAHNEESVIGEILEALLQADYPRDRLTLMPIDDRSSDGTRERIAEWVQVDPRLIRPFHRDEGRAGKAAALQDAMEMVDTDIVLVFDADYVPSQGLVKQLVAPFFDPEVGAVMGRVVPHNVGANLLTRLLDLERSGGYQVDQQARMNLHLVPQYGGTVGGVRKAALVSVGGWTPDALAEDTDATYRLLLGGWKTVYQNRSECYEQVPEDWTSRLHQIRRWAMGHNQSALRYGARLWRSQRTAFVEKVDGWLLLGVYQMAPIVVLGWGVGVVLWYMGEIKPGLILILLITSYCALGNFATFFEVAAAAHLDGSRARIRLLPFISLGFLVSLFAVTKATASQLTPWRHGSDVFWHKTEHPSNPIYTNGNGAPQGHGTPRIVTPADRTPGESS